MKWMLDACILSVDFYWIWRDRSGSEKLPGVARVKISRTPLHTHDYFNLLQFGEVAGTRVTPEHLQSPANRMITFNSFQGAALLRAPRNRHGSTAQKSPRMAFEVTCEANFVAASA
jgi:hypothetical protein